MKARTLLAASALLALAVVAQTARAVSPELVHYRMTGWKSLHLNDEKKAQTLYTTFKKMGCECKQESHGDHVDLKVRCAKWRRVGFKTHAEAHKWEDWLKKIGFETRHEH